MSVGESKTVRIPTFGEPIATTKNSKFGTHICKNSLQVQLLTTTINEEYQLRDIPDIPRYLFPYIFHRNFKFPYIIYLFELCWMKINVHRFIYLASDRKKFSRWFDYFTAFCKAHSHLRSLLDAVTGRRASTYKVGHALYRMERLSFFFQGQMKRLDIICAALEIWTPNL